MAAALRDKEEAVAAAEAAALAAAGPDRYHSPRHILPCTSRNEGSKCVG